MKYKGRDINELSEEELRVALRDILFKYNTVVHEMIAIKTGIINVPPEKSYGDWTEKPIRSLKEAKEHAGNVLERVGYRSSLL